MQLGIRGFRESEGVDFVVKRSVDLLIHLLLGKKSLGRFWWIEGL